MLETKFILRANIRQRSLEKLAICMEFFFFKEKLIKNTKSHFDINLSKQKVTISFVFMEIYG